ncbi:hypothetical protein Q2T40_14970 [Winogradskyella maritima]|uniref:Carboxypeptidase-like protein n=1 Tax=Winogradskyella maritima TaxID=1517766 RepID=A0ABV8AJV1_9FLAO|nr:hypothetical protein [Winogradskyella maritima]
MKTIYLFLSLLSVSLFSGAQEIIRVEISGKIVVDSDEREGITVYNSSSNKGVTTEANGTFKINVALNDVVEFGALQFKDFTVRVDENVMKSKQMTVYLVEDVNKLDEVIVLPYDLTGNLATDLETVRTFNVDMDDIYTDAKNTELYEYTADENTKVDNPFTNREFKYGLNIINLVGLFTKKKKTNPELESELQTPISKRYNAKYINENFNIPLNQVDAFFDYLKGKELDERLLEKNNELLLIDYIRKQSQLFLIERGKN